MIVFSADGSSYTSDCLIDGNNDIYDQNGGWTSSFELTEDEIIGTPLSSSGYAHHKKVSLPTAQWQQALTEGDPVLHVHTV